MIQKTESDRINPRYLTDLSLFTTKLTASTASNLESEHGETPSKTNVTFSSLAHQLSESAIRAETAYAGLSRKELSEKAAATQNMIGGTVYEANRAVHNIEIPDSGDAERLARASDATKFVNGTGKNPFKDLSRDRLDLIIYDDSGRYTVNERRAASGEVGRQEYEWRKTVVAKAQDEYNRTGKLTHFFSDVLEHYKSLPTIEQAQYPDAYEGQLEQLIELDYNYLTNKVEGKGSPGDPMTLTQGLDIINQFGLPPR